MTPSPINPHAELEERLRFETLIADLSSKFVNLPPGEVDREIMDAERHICEVLDLDISALWQWSDEAPGSFTLTHFYSAQERPPLPERMSSREYFPWVHQQMLAGRILALSSLEEMPAEAARDREIGRQLGIKSNLTIPLAVGGQPPIGALGLNTTRAERNWPEALVKRLQLVAQILANALARNRADQALRQSEERFRLLIEQAPEAVIVLDLEQNRLVEANARAERLFGCSRQELLAGGPQRFYTPEQPDGQPIAQSMCDHNERALRGETVFFERTIRNASGQRLHCEVRLVRLPAAERKLLRASFIDVTDRKRAEEAFRASEARLAAGTELAGLGYHEVDYGGRTCFLDARFREICGVPPDLEQGLTAVEFWKEHLHPDDRHLLLDERQKLHDGRSDHLSMEYRYLHPTQGQKWIHHLARVAARDASGRAIRTFGVIRDITQQKQAELEARELRDNLTHLTRVNTLGALSGSLAHELNQPLGIILSNAQAAQELLAQAPPDVAEVQAILADIVKADRRAGEVIERLRALLKHGKICLQPLPLNQALEEVLHLTRADLIGRGITVRRELAPDLPPVAGDRVQLQQLVLNLILNAADAMAANAPGTRRLHLQTQLHQGHVRASVRDEGSGLPTNVERLFQPFYTTKPHGLGLGLSICRSIVAAHDGRLWAEPHPKRGAVFHFELPAAASPEQA
jgi:PAS domain S-box-containing protein